MRLDIILITGDVFSWTGKFRWNHMVISDGLQIGLWGCCCILCEIKPIKRSQNLLTIKYLPKKEKKQKKKGKVNFITSLGFLSGFLDKCNIYMCNKSCSKKCLHRGINKEIDYHTN